MIYLLTEIGLTPDGNSTTPGGSSTHAVAVVPDVIVKDSSFDVTGYNSKV